MDLRFRQSQLKAIPRDHLQNEHIAMFFITFRFEREHFVSGGHKVSDFPFLEFKFCFDHIKYFYFFNLVFGS